MLKRFFIGFLILMVFGGIGLVLQRTAEKTVLPDTIQLPRPSNLTASPLPVPVPSSVPSGTPGSERSEADATVTASDFVKALKSSEVKLDSAGKVIFSRTLIPVGRVSRLNVKIVLRAFLKSQGLAHLQYDAVTTSSSVGDATQYFFAQTVDGLPIFPTTGISFIVEAEKDLAGIDADYLQQIQVSGTLPPPAPAGSTLVVYRSNDGRTEKGTYAYKTLKNGIETLTDPKTGKIIYEKSIRQY